MKKFTIVLLVLALSCACIFAADFSFTVGGGFGGMREFNEYENYDSEKDYCFGPNVFFGFDFATEEGFSIYNDIAFTFDAFPKTSRYVQNTLTENFGVGYTLDFGKLSLMAGAGMDLQCHFKTAKKDNLYALNTTMGILGINGRLKGMIHFTEHWGLSVQANGTVDLYEFTKYGIKNFGGRENTSNLILSGLAMVGAVFTI